MVPYGTYITNLVMTKEEDLLFAVVDYLVKERTYIKSHLNPIFFLIIYFGLCFTSLKILAIYSPKMPIDSNCTPPKNIMDTIIDG